MNLNINEFNLYIYIKSVTLSITKMISGFYLLKEKIRS